METPASTSVDFDPFAGNDIERVVETTEAQREIWLACQLGDEASLAYNLSTSLLLKGSLNADALARALAEVVARHEALRSTIGPEGTDLWIASASNARLESIDLGDLSAGERTARLDAVRLAAVEQPFDLESGPLLRATLVRIDAVHHEFILSAHHIVCDGGSIGILVREIVSLYRAHAKGQLPALSPAAQYSDFSSWLVTPEAVARIGQDEDYWARVFADSTPILELPTDRPRTAVRSFGSKREERLLGEPLVSVLQQVAAGQGASLFSLLFGSFAALLSRLGGESDVVIGVPAAGQTVDGFSSLVGHCVNLLPIRINIDEAKDVRQLARSSSAAVLDAYEHQLCTFGSLLKKLKVGRDPGRMPLVSVMFNVSPRLDEHELSDDALRVRLASNPRQFENFELSLNVARTGKSLVLECQYNTDLFDAQTIARWLGMYEVLLQNAARDPATPVGRLSLVSPADATALRAMQPEPTVWEGAALMHAGFALQAAEQSGRAALRHGDLRMNYGQLDAQSNRLARALRQRGVQRGRLVGLCLPRDAQMVVALLAILKAGGTYVPLDPDFPTARLDYYAEDADLAVLLTRSDVESAPRSQRLLQAGAVLELDVDTSWTNQSANTLASDEMSARPGDAAYVIYTSGSTGKPKGVAVPHGAVANFLLSMRRTPGISADDRLVAVTTLSFDIAVLELMLPLTVGAEVVIAPRETVMDGAALTRLLVDSEATIMQATPGMWRLLIDAGWEGRPGFKALVGGESLAPDLARDMLDRTRDVWNMYGPTETTIWSTLWHVDPSRIRAGGISIGRPIDNTTVWILDAHLESLPIGVPGEICIGGDGVAIGYLNRPELTEDRFVTIDIDGVPSRIYRTGDRGRWRNDGLLEHMGRLDFQVKVRGYRIELGEIEARCNEAAGVTRSVVVTREDTPGDVRLVAYLAMAPDSTLDRLALDEHLRARLPQYMLPQHVVTLPALPLLPNGKVNRKALPGPTLHVSATAAREHVAPRTERERAVLEAMTQVLRAPQMGVTDDFFAMGGHSLLAARVTARLARQFDIALPLRTLFEQPTAQGLAQAIDTIVKAGAPHATRLQHLAGRSRAPLTPMQERVRFMEELNPGRPVYNMPFAQRLQGRLDVPLFEAALVEIARRQPALRTAIAADAESGGWMAAIALDARFELPFVDLSHLPLDEREALLRERAQELAEAPIDIRRAPLAHARLFKLSDEEHAFVFVAHHLVWDGASFDVFQAELSAIYGALTRGEPHALAPLEVDYGDYAQWYANWLSQPAFRQQLDEIKSRFASVPAPRSLTTDMPRGGRMSGRGETLWIELSPATSERLRQAAQKMDVTLSMFTLGVCAAMMSGVLGSPSVVVANPVRGREQPELEPVIGFFNNLLPIPFRVDPALSLRAFMAYVKTEMLAFMRDEPVPFEVLAAEPEFKQRTQRTPLYQALFSFQDVRERPETIGTLRQSNIPLQHHGATDDIGIWLRDTSLGLRGAVTFNADLYLPETGAAFRDRFVELLLAAVDGAELGVGEFTARGKSASAAILARTAAAETARNQPAPAPQAAKVPLLMPEHARLAQVWASVIGIDVNEIRASDNFFDLGGDSLMAMRAVDESAQALGFKVEPRRYVFESLAQLASVPATGAGFATSAASAPTRGFFGRMFAAAIGRRT
ncbi:amino acid adenylation domain-containing protein [Variovorax sp. J22P168]|uniref:non-ribosomal peptide synthetase n=1 Tax=Variovorax jilinensis TaxID=3053513 RepID=UPI002576CABD|nr:non-ribosomal peptide synthetase [Variovorax sp. J22P168]MDM0011240.1 amino acid adenylation domain-containing protein [Variovorax sp. J22P168]